MKVKSQWTRGVEGTGTSELTFSFPQFSIFFSFVEIFRHQVQSPVLFAWMEGRKEFDCCWGWTWTRWPEASENVIEDSWQLLGEGQDGVTSRLKAD